MFVTFDGVDGAGKTSIMHRVAEAFRELKYPCRDVRTFRLPSSTIREYIVNAAGELTQEDLMYLNMLGAGGLSPRIRHRLKLGSLILMDRWVASTYAYNVHGIQDSSKFKLALTSASIVRPTVRVRLTVDPKVARERIAMREGADMAVLDKMFADQQQRICEGFNLLNFDVVVDTTDMSIDEAAAAIYVKLVKWLGKEKSESDISMPYYAAKDIGNRFFKEVNKC